MRCDEGEWGDGMGRGGVGGAHVAGGGEDHQRRDTALGGASDVGVLREELRDQLGRARLCGKEQRRDAALDGIDLRASSEEHLGERLCARGHRMHKEGHAVANHVVRVGVALLEQIAHLR
jgi:hypothetical protein